MGTNEKQAKPNVEVINGFTVPKWASKPPNGLHLDVMKDGKMIQKLMIDEKKCYFFGRNKDTCDFVTDHASCSRVHAVLLWHKDLNRSFIVDMNSTHGTFIGSLRLEPNKPQQVFVDSELKFGASTRTYIVREKPQLNKHAINPSSILNSSALDSMNESGTDKDDSFSILTHLPESETEIDNLTEFNTAHNKRIAQLVEITTSSSMSNPAPSLVKQKRKSVSFNEEEEVINPEDIDPSIGRFRNLVQTTIVIPNKKKKLDPNQPQSMLVDDIPKKITQTRLSLYDEEDEESSRTHRDSEFESRFGLTMRSFDIAPDVDEDYHQAEKRPAAEVYPVQEFDQAGQPIERKKKYAKEAWPGRHPNSQIPPVAPPTNAPAVITSAPIVPGPGPGPGAPTSGATKRLIV